jgi:hypothetical protein
MDPMRGKSPQSSLSTANVYQHWSTMRNPN